MKYLFIIFIQSIIFNCFSATAQTKVVGECVLQFQIDQIKGSDTILFGTKAVFVKGNQCKTTLTTPQFTQTLLFNVQETKAMVTKEFGEAKFLQYVTYPPKSSPTLLSMKEMGDTSVSILGYSCKRLDLKWSDGSLYELYYTSEMIPTVNTFELAFKEVPGLVLAYTVVDEEGSRVNYRATMIDLNPLSLSQFNINSSLYQTIDSSNQ